MLRRNGDVESAVQTESAIESIKRKSEHSVDTQDNSTQVKLEDLPDFEASLLPQMEEMVNQTLENAFVEILEEEEIKEIRQHRLQHQQMKQAELTTSKLMNVDT